MKEHRLSAAQGSYLTFLYCLPALLILAILIGNYSVRVGEVADFIAIQKATVEETYKNINGQKGERSAEAIVNALKEDKTLNQILSTTDEAHQNERKLINYYIRYYGDAQQAGTTDSNQQINHELQSIWLRNSSIIIVMTLVPFLLLGGRFGFSNTLPLNFDQRRSVVFSGLWMKCVVALIIAYGWLYIVNPQGRGASTVAQFLVSVDLSQTDTLPLLLRDIAITPVIAAFLGWYLYTLTYFFSKMTSNDVVSAQAYGMLFQKFLFTWGVTIVFIATQLEENANITAFLIGYFPMAAFSLIKDKGLNILQGGNHQDNGQLSELPGISRWQILRLEEEGIDSLAALAYRSRDNIDHHLPAMARLVDYWTDIARLYTILGKEGYDKIEQTCLTASEFVRKADNPEFKEAIAGVGINNPEEISRLLRRTFPELEEEEEINQRPPISRAA